MLRILHRHTLPRLHTLHSTQKTAMSTDKSSASMVGGHAQYAKGYIEETVGNVAGSKEWQESGKADAQAGIEEMKTANANRKAEPASSGVGGRIEEMAGKTTGCEGMESEGKTRQGKVE